MLIEQKFKELFWGCRYNGRSFYYILTLYFEIIVEMIVVCNILSFLLHPYGGMVWIMCAN